MLKHLNRMIDLNFTNRAFAAALAVVICFNLSAGFLTADTVYADEEQPVTSEEDSGDKDEPKSEEPEDKGNKDGSGSKKVMWKAFIFTSGSFMPERVTCLCCCLRSAGGAIRSRSTASTWKRPMATGNMKTGRSSGTTCAHFIWNRCFR